MTQDENAGASLAKDDKPAPSPADGAPATAEAPAEDGKAVSQSPPETPVRVAQGDHPLYAFVTGGTYGVLALLGLVAGVISSFNYGWTAGSFPLAAVLLVALTGGGLWLAGWATGGRLGAVIPWLTWMAIVIIMSTQRSEGDLVISGGTAGYVFIVGGMVAGGLAIAFTRSARPAGSWLLGGAAGDPPVM